jgi:hypothetical protein
MIGSTMPPTLCGLECFRKWITNYICSLEKRKISPESKIHLKLEVGEAVPLEKEDSVDIQLLKLLKGS